MKLTYPACFYQDEKDGSYAVVVPDLPCCVSGGATLAESHQVNFSQILQDSLMEMYQKRTS